MNRLYSIVLAAAFLYAAPIIATPSSVGQIGGGSSVHFKTVGEGVWPYQVDEFAGKSRNALFSLPTPGDGHWI